jgi:hypothetical protein
VKERGVGDETLTAGAGGGVGGGVLERFHVVVDCWTEVELLTGGAEGGEDREVVPCAGAVALGGEKPRVVLVLDLTVTLPGVLLELATFKEVGLEAGVCSWVE